MLPPGFIQGRRLHITFDNSDGKQQTELHCRATLKETLDILTSSTHKEINIGARRQHDNILQGLVRQLDKYFDTFLIGSARHMKTGVEIDHNIVIGLLSSMESGEKFQRISWPEIQSHRGRQKVLFWQDGQKATKDPKAVNVLKEDRQAFGLLVGKVTTSEEVHSYTLTTVPLALATPERDLRQGSKAALRNYLIEESNSITEELPTRGNWLLMDCLLWNPSLLKRPGEYIQISYWNSACHQSNQSHCR